MARVRKASAHSVDAIVHKKARRTNIPTAELEAFITEQDATPKKVQYRRDPSLDPQLVWRGKDEQDSHPLEVPAVPIYIQEKISPEALIENLRVEQRKNDDQPELFAQFDGLEFDKVVDFYHHSQSWTNRMILGDSLAVMVSLSEKEGLKGGVQTIYIDPPYGIRFGSNWQVSTRKRDVKDGRPGDITAQPEQVLAFRDAWELGIHSYLSYLRDRLRVSWELLTETGSIFVQIGEENVHLVRALLDEVFGSANACPMLAFRTKIPLRTTLVPSIYDYILWYAKDKQQVKFRRLFKNREVGAGTQFTWLEQPDGVRRRMTPQELESESWPAGCRPFRLTDLVSAGRTESCVFEFELDGRKFFPSGNKSWKTNREGMERLLAAHRLMAPGDAPAYVFFADDYPVEELANVWADTQGASDRVYVVQTATKVVERCVLMTTDPGDLVIDPMSGSGTTGFVSEEWGRRWIMIDTSRVALALARTRLMAARYPFYVLADSTVGRHLLGDSVPSFADNRPPPEEDVRKGFIYKKVRHVTIGSITSNSEIRPGMMSDELRSAIVRGAEMESLFDQAEVDSTKVRVTGPFTVETLTPHRMLDPIASESEASERRLANAAFEDLVLENLRTSGVQNTVKNERLKFERLEPWSGVYINGVGEYVENGKVRRAAICIGPEYGTVGLDLVREAAKEASRFFDLLIICGFAFEALVGEEASYLGRLTVLKASMNPDLLIGRDLLKKTPSANLFMIFGEPDIEIVSEPDEKIVVHIKGLDVYDPTSGQIRSHSIDDIACWFIDTDYNGESFFVRHAYFLGAGDPYEQLRRVLKAEINESLWATIYRSISRPFARPTTGKVAVKVINHYGDEVLKIYDLKSPDGRPAHPRL